MCANASLLRQWPRGATFPGPLKDDWDNAGTSMRVPRAKPGAVVDPCWALGRWAPYTVSWTNPLAMIAEAELLRSVTYDHQLISRACRTAHLAISVHDLFTTTGIVQLAQAGTASK